MLSAIITPLAFLALPVVSLAAVVWLWQWRLARSRRRSPLARDFLRSPGESLGQELTNLNDELLSHFLLAFLLPLILYATYASQALGGAIPNGWVFWVVGTVGYVYVGYKLLRILVSRQHVRLGLEAELAVGQELNQLMRDGYWVFHDVPADNFNIDHVVVGPNGVFAVETKGRAKPLDKQGRAKWKVEYDGETLKFPSLVERRPLEQAAWQARWLQDWLSKATGSVVKVKPVLALPGWWIDRISPRGIPVFNGKNPIALFSKIGEGPLTSESITRIVHQLDQRCRTVQRKAYRTNKDPQARLS